MNSSPTKKNAQINGATPSADPFAADIFAAPKINENLEPDKTQIAENVEGPGWVWRLPKADRPAVNWTNLIQNLPAEFSEHLSGQLAVSLANLVNAEENSLKIKFVENREALDEQTVEDVSETVNLWRVLISIEPAQANLIVEVEDFFAVWLIDNLLGETESVLPSPRNLTNSEIAVLEYVFVNLIYELNAKINAPFFRLVSLNRKMPRLITNNISHYKNYKFISTWQAEFVNLKTLIKIYLAPDSFEALRRVESDAAMPLDSKTFRRLTNRVGEARARLILGEAALTLAEAAGIETGDVILLESVELKIDKRTVSGRAEIFLGDGENFRLSGIIKQTPFEMSFEPAARRAEVDKSLVRRVKSNQELRLLISGIDALPSANFLDKSMNEELVPLTEESVEEFALESNGRGVPLENLSVKMRVELETRRLSLAEVGSLRVNQIIELGATAVDPVNLVINEKIIARGELVEVDERLGVRIIQILR